MSFSERGEALLAKLRQDRLSAKNQKPVFGPPPSKAIFRRKWCDKLNAQLHKLPRHNHVESDVPFQSGALELGIAFSREAASLGYLAADFGEETGLDMSKVKDLAEINCSNPYYAFAILNSLINGAAKLWADQDMDVWRYYMGSEQQKAAAREQAEDFLVRFHEAAEARVWDARLTEEEEQSLEARTQKFKSAPRAGGPKWW